MNVIFSQLPKNLQGEGKLLHDRKIITWGQIALISDELINKIVETSLCSEKNFKRLRCIAKLICEINVSQSVAALLMHSGISSYKALRSLTPQELLEKTGRFERRLGTGRRPVIDLKKANLLIKKAKQANN